MMFMVIFITIKMIKRDRTLSKTSGKMTLTINSEIYSQLLSKYQPRIIQGL
jgi:hypothetical protein